MINETTFKPDGLLVLPHLRVQNANAISSPLTWGFPSPTAFLGFTHALERGLRTGYDQAFGGVGIVCHSFEAQTFRPNRRQQLVFTQSRNPLYLKRDVAKFISEGTPPAIVEEGRVHLEVSIVIAVRGSFNEELEEQAFAEAAYERALGMRLAGGSVLPPQGLRMPKPQWISWPEVAVDQSKAFARLRRRLLPSFTLVHRPDLLGEHLEKLKTQNDSATVLDALLDITRLNHSPSLPTNEGQENVEWQIEKRPGWLVPLPIGYAGISPLYSNGEVTGSRDSTTPLRFVESLCSLGQWISPLRLNQLEQMLWLSAADSEAGLYRCINHYAKNIVKSRTESELNPPQGA